MKRVAIYLRVSTDKQTTDNQRREKLGRRRVKPSVEARIVELRAEGHGILKIRKMLGIGTSVVQRVFTQEPWQA